MALNHECNALLGQIMYLSQIDMTHMRPDSKGDVPTELAPIFDAAKWKRVGVLEEDSFLHSFSYASDVKYQKLSVDVKETYVASARRKLATALKKALTSKDPSWASLVEEHSLENLEAFQKALGKRTYTELDVHILSDILSQVHHVNIITWRHDAGFTPFGMDRLSDDKFVFLVNARGKHWEPLVYNGTSLFDITDDITVHVLKYIRESRMASVHETAVEEDLGWKETMILESDVVFSEDLGFVDIQTIRDIEASDLSMEQVETQLFDLVSSQFKQRFLKRTVNGLSRLFYDIVHYKETPRLDIHGGVPIILAKYKPIEDEDGENIYRHDRAVIRNTNRESYAEQRLRLNDMQMPILPDGPVNWTPNCDTDAEMRQEDEEVENDSSLKRRVRILAPITTMRGYPYGGDKVSVTGIASPFQGPYWKLNKNIKSYSMDEYEDAIAALASQDKLRITFTAPYYSKDDKLVDEIDATVVTTTSSNIQLKLEYAVHRRGDELLTNSLFYQRNAHNDFILFPALMIRTGCAPDADSAWSIYRGQHELSELVNMVTPTIPEWLVMNRHKLAEYDNPLDIEYSMRMMGWSIDNLNSTHMSLLRDLLRPPSKAKAHLQREILPVQGRKLIPIFKANANLIKRLYGSTRSEPDNRFWLHLFKEHIAEFIKSNANKTYSDRLKEIHRVLPEHENHIKELEETYELKRAEMVYKKEYASLEELCRDQDKFIPEWEGEFAFSPVEEDKKIANCLFKRFNGRWILLGKWKDTNGSMSMLPYHASVYPPKWMPVMDTESLTKLRDTMQSLRRVTSLRTMEAVLSKFEGLPILEKAITESEENVTTETYIQTFYTEQVRVDLNTEELRLQEQDDADTGFVEDYEMQQYYELMSEDTADKVTMNSDLDALCKYLGIVIPPDEEKQLVELIPYIMTGIVDTKYKKFSESSAGAKLKQVRGYKQQLIAMLGEDKGTAFDKEYSLYIIASIVSVLLIILPIQPKITFRSFKLPDVLDAMATILTKEFAFNPAQPHIKIMDDIVNKILFKNRPIYKARFENAPLKKPLTVDINMKTSRFRPPLVPISDIPTSRSGVSLYLHSLYSKFVNMKSNSSKDKQVNSCCFDKVHVGMRYSDVLGDIKIPPSKGVLQEAEPSIQHYLPRKIAANLFKDQTVRVNKEDVHKIAFPEKRKIEPVTLQMLLRKNPLLVNSEEIDSITFNDISERVKDTFAEQWDLTRELLSRSGEDTRFEVLPPKSDISKFVIDLGENADYYRLLQGIEHFLDYDIRRLAGRFFWKSKWATTMAKWVELILSFSLNRIAGAVMTDILYVYQYVVVRTMFLLMWAFTVPPTADFRARLESSNLSDCSEAIREFVVAASSDEVESMAAFFKSMWIAYYNSIKNALIKPEELKTRAEELRETDKNNKMSRVSNMSTEDAQIYRTLKEAGLTSTFGPMTVIDEDKLEGAEEPAELISERPNVDYDLDTPEGITTYIADDYLGENPDMMEDD